MFEINLVPDVKAEMIKAQKKRNVVFFMSAVVSAIAAGLVVLLLTIKTGQDIKLKSQDNQLTLMSNTIEKYDGLSELLTVQKQLSDLNTIARSKSMLSRVFTVLHSIVQAENGDEINITSLDVNLETSELTFDGQANAGPSTDGIDYRVLESFTKSIGLMKYDYGRYVDRNGQEIPTMCIFESNVNGSPYRDKNGIYALWKKGAEGCDPSSTDSDDTSSSSYYYDDDDEDKDKDDSEGSSNGSSTTSGKKQLDDIDLPADCAGADGKNVVCIYRTPQYTEWYSKGYMKLDGSIENIPHFASQCVSYEGIEIGSSVQWNSKVSDECLMAPEGIEVLNSTNGKETGGELVLMFSAVLHMNPEVFSFNNKHMITISPSGRQNVTDSFVQVGDMFAERAKALGGEE